MTGTDCNKENNLYIFCIIMSKHLLQISTGRCATFKVEIDIQNTLSEKLQTVSCFGHESNFFLIPYFLFVIPC